MFSLVCVILFTGGRGTLVPQGEPSTLDRVTIPHIPGRTTEEGLVGGQERKNDSPHPKAGSGLA